MSYFLVCHIQSNRASSNCNTPILVRSYINWKRKKMYALLIRWKPELLISLKDRENNLVNVYGSYDLILMKNKMRQTLKILRHIDVISLAVFWCKRQLVNDLISFIKSLRCQTFRKCLCFYADIYSLAM